MFIICISFCLIFGFICLIYQRKLPRQQNPKAKQALGKLLLRSVSVPMFYFSLERMSLKNDLLPITSMHLLINQPFNIYYYISLGCVIMIFTQLSCNVRKITVDDMGILFVNQLIYDLVWEIVFLLFFFIKSIIREQNTVMYIDKNFPCYKHQLKFPLEIQHH